MKIATLIVRILLGALLLFASLAFLLAFAPAPELSGDVKVFMDGLTATGYLMPVVKVTELLCGIALVSGFFVPLALVVLAPITVNIVLFHTLLDLSGVGVALFLLTAHLFLAYAYRAQYRPLFTPRVSVD